MKPLLVVLDLDETLVHIPAQPLAARPDFTVDGYAGYRRPQLASFLAQLRERYQLAVWTSANRNYAESVLAEVMPWRAELVFLWCSEQCSAAGAAGSSGLYKAPEKLAKAGFDLKRLVIVDDSPEKHLHSYRNLLPVLPFLGDPSDKELAAVLRYLEWLDAQPDVGSVDKRDWRPSVEAALNEDHNV
jgi:RNA polymerase II subunit A small phosphatase-like protein